MEHSLIKWTGARRENIEKHDLIHNGQLLTSADRQTDNAQFKFNADTCALCQNYLTCDDCPLSAVGDTVIKESLEYACQIEYDIFVQRGSPEPMIVLLQSAPDHTKNSN